MSTNINIYIIGPEGGPYKVGYTADLNARLSTLQTGQAVPIKIFYSEETEEEKAKVIEKLIHRQLAPKRIRGEWFNLPLDDMIAEVKYAFIRWESEPALAFRFRRKLL